MINNNNILNYAIVGYEFEMFSKFTDKEVADQLEKLLNKKIPVFDKHHSELEVNDKIFKIEKDFSGGKKMMELITGPLPYTESIIILKKVLDWISINGYTNSKSSIHINISFDKKILGKNFISHMNVLKFILDFDEDITYKYFQNRKESVYAKSIKHIMPTNKFYLDDAKGISTKDFLVPSIKYYGVNFLKLVKGYLEFRYIGGKDYEKHFDKIKELQDYYITSLYNSIINKQYTEDNKNELKRILNEHRHILNGFKSYKNFINEFKDIKLFYDLNSDPIILNTVYNNIRGKLFDILNYTNIKSGMINYNIDTGHYEIKGAVMNKIFELRDVDLIECELTGFLYNVSLFDCKVKNTDIHDSKIYNCNISSSKIENSYVNQKTELIDCYIYGKNGITNGSVKGGIFREGKITSDTIFDDSVEVIKYTIL